MNWSSLLHCPHFISFNFVRLKTCMLLIYFNQTSLYVSDYNYLMFCTVQFIWWLILTINTLKPHSSEHFGEVQMYPNKCGIIITEAEMQTVHITEASVYLKSGEVLPYCNWLLWFITDFSPSHKASWAKKRESLTSHNQYIIWGCFFKHTNYARETVSL